MTRFGTAETLSEEWETLEREMPAELRIPSIVMIAKAAFYTGALAGFQKCADLAHYPTEQRKERAVALLNEALGELQKVAEEEPD